MHRPKRACYNSDIMRTSSGFSEIAVVGVVCALILIASGAWFFMAQKYSAAPSGGQAMTLAPTPLQSKQSATPAQTALVSATPQTTVYVAPSTRLTPAPQISATVKPKTLTWSQDNGVRMASSSAPYVMKLANGTFRMYYWTSQGIVSALSRDGMQFTQEPGIRIAPDQSDASSTEFLVTDPTVADTGNGTVRMYYTGMNGTLDPASAQRNIFSAISSDGLQFTKEGVRIDSQQNENNNWVAMPEAVRHSDGTVYLYYDSHNPNAGGGIMVASSKDGLQFNAGVPLVQSTGLLIDPSVLRMPNETYVMLAVSVDKSLPPYADPGIYYLDSGDGLVFQDFTPIMKGGNMYDPSGVQIDPNTIRIFYTYLAQGSSPEIRSLTGTIQ